MKRAGSESSGLMEYEVLEGPPSTYVAALNVIVTQDC